MDDGFPSLSQPIRFSYGVPSDVLFVEPSSSNCLVETIHSTVGSRQGDVWGSCTYCLALHPILERLNEEYGDRVLIVAYCDDVYIVGPPADAAAAYARWRALYAAFMEGELRDDKGHAYSQGCSEEAAREAGIPASMSFTSAGLRVLGSPVGTDAFVKSFVDEAADAVIEALRVLARAPLAQARHAIQQKSLSAKLILHLPAADCADGRPRLSTMAHRQAGRLCLS